MLWRDQRQAHAIPFGSRVTFAIVPTLLRLPGMFIRPGLIVATYSDSLRILVIDDDPGLRGLLTALFEREGWSVTTAADGEVAVQQLALAPPDVVILDLMLPKLMGLEVLQQMTTQDPAWGQRVLIVTAIAEVQLRRLPAGLGVWQIVRKPFDNTELVQSVQACATRHARPRPEASAAQ